MFIFADVRRKVTVINELLALSLLINSVRDIYMYIMGSLYFIIPNDMTLPNKSDSMTTYFL